MLSEKSELRRLRWRERHDRWGWLVNGVFYNTAKAARRRAHLLLSDPNYKYHVVIVRASASGQQSRKIFSTMTPGQGRIYNWIYGK